MKVLFASTQDVKRYSALQGSIDADNFITHIEIAQKKHVEPVLGTDLFERIETEVNAGSISTDIDNLIKEYIKPITINYTLVEYLRIAPYEFTNKGIMKPTSENSSQAGTQEVESLIQHYRNTAETYVERFQNFMVYNQDKFPEWNTNSEDDLYPNYQEPFHGWQLD